MAEEKYRRKSPACQGTGTKAGKWLPLPVAVGAGILLGGAALALGTLAYAYIATHPFRRRLHRNPTVFGLDYEEVTFSSGDGLRLNGWLIPPPQAGNKRAVVVLCHGYPANRAEMLPHAQMLHAAGYTTLLFDFRALGESEGDICTAGMYEVADLEGALDYLGSRADTRGLTVGVLGNSLGGAVGIMVAARDERIRAVVSEGSYPDLEDAIEARFRIALGPLAKGIALPIRLWAQRWIADHPRTVAPKHVIGAISPRAVMIVQGQRDLLVRWKDAVRMYEEAGEPRELWLMKNVHHARGMRDAPEEYARRVCAFFARHLNPI